MTAHEPTPRRTLRPGDHVVIIGAGPAGLTAAYLLAKQGIAATILEGDTTVGGISRTVEYRGYRFDIGGHRFFTKFPPVEALWQELLGSEFISVPRLSRIYYDGKYFDYPLRPLNALRGLGFWRSTAAVASYLRSRLRPTPEENTLEQWVSNRFGRRLYEVFFKSYTEKVWGIPCHEISAEWAAQRIQNLSLGRAITSSLPLTRRSSDVRSLLHEFTYPRLGPGQMWEACAERVVEMGGDLRLGHRATQLRTVEDAVVEVVAHGPDGEVTIACDHVISTMPIRSLVRALSPRPAPEIEQAGERLRYRDFLVVAVILEGAEIFPDNWIYVHSPDVRVGRIQNFKNWSAAMVPDPGRTCLGLEYFCFKGDDTWNLPDDALIELASRELETLGLARRADVRDGTVVRMPKAYPVYDPEYPASIATVRSTLDGISNLQLVGRNGLHKYNNQDHSMLTALMAVANLQGASHDLWAVNTDYEYHEEIRVPATEKKRRRPALQTT